jgi:uracil-DNA glycosylase family 4
MSSWEPKSLDEFNRSVVECDKCPRLVRYRALVAERKPPRFKEWDYWSRPLPGFGDPLARILILGLAPAAHGGNRTGRMFTGDSSGEFLFGSLFRCGLSNKPTSERPGDGLLVTGVYITAALRCVPPKNLPTRDELDNCFVHLNTEFRLLPNIRVIVALGAIAYDAARRLVDAPRSKFAHGALVDAGGLKILASYHPSRRNTQTGLLTSDMIDQVFEKAKQIAGLSN